MHEWSKDEVYVSFVRLLGLHVPDWHSGKIDIALTFCFTFAFLFFVWFREGNGFTFDSYSHGDFVWAVKRALRVFSNPEEYASLRESAYETTIDVAQVSWAWACEFHRLRNACFTRANVVCMAISASSTEESEVMDPSSRLVTIEWPGAGDNVLLKGSFDGWTAEWTLADSSPSVDSAAPGGGGSKNDGKALTLRLRPGTYSYKFKVDGTWCLADGQGKHIDGSGLENNCLHVT